MFVQQGRNHGWIEVICGPMFSGKTEELIRRLKLAQIAKQRVQIFKPALDRRYDEGCITSHAEQKFICTPIQKIQKLMENLDDETRVVGIDEAQFFGPEISEICNKVANRGLRVIAAGLDQDYLGNAFGPMPKLLAIADTVLKLKAVCMVCGGEASKSQRLTRESTQVVVGAGEHYEARCRACFDPSLKVTQSLPALPVSKVRTQNGKSKTRAVIPA